MATAIELASAAAIDRPWNKEIHKTLEFMGQPYSSSQLFSLRVPEGIPFALGGLLALTMLFRPRQTAKRRLARFITLSLLCLWGTWAAWNSPKNPKVVRQPTALLRNPDLTDSAGIMIPAMTRVHVLRKSGQFYQVKAPDGYKGFLPPSAFSP